MTIISGIVVFVIVWWIVIFCVLPVGMSSTQEKADEGEYIAPGAPKFVNMKKKFILTTVISIFVWVVIYILIKVEVVNFRELSDALY